MLKSVTMYFAKKRQPTIIGLALYKKVLVLPYIGKCRPRSILEDVKLAQCYEVLASLDICKKVLGRLQNSRSYIILQGLYF